MVIIEPGAIKTDWGIIAANHLVESSKGTAYEDKALRESVVMRNGYSSRYLAPPSAVTRSIVRAVKARKPRTRYLSGSGARSIVFWHAVLPARWWDSLMRMMASREIERLSGKLR